MLVVFVHGWSVTNTGTYGGLPEALVRNAPPRLNLQVEHLYLSKYVSFADEVQVDDIARGMEHAIHQEVVPKLEKGDYLTIDLSLVRFLADWELTAL